MKLSERPVALTLDESIKELVEWAIETITNDANKNRDNFSETDLATILRINQNLLLDVAAYGHFRKQNFKTMAIQLKLFDHDDQLLENEIFTAYFIKFIMDEIRSCLDIESTQSDHDCLHYSLKIT